MCMDDGREPHIASEMKHGTSGGQHRRLEGKIHLQCQFLLKLVALFKQDFAVPVIQRGCFLMDAQVVLWSNLLQSRPLQDFHYGGWSCHVQFAMLVILSLVTIFLSIPLHQ